MSSSVYLQVIKCFAWKNMLKQSSKVICICTQFSKNLCEIQSAYTLILLTATNFQVKRTYQQNRRILLRYAACKIDCKDNSYWDYFTECL